MLNVCDVCYEIQDKKKRKVILSHISYEFKRGITVITGPNGSGKSTLAKVIMGIIQPSSGTIFLDNDNITNMSLTDRAKNGISFAFQTPIKLKGIRVSDLLKIASSGSHLKQKGNDLLAAVGLDGDEYLNREIDGSLSGGELKRIEIASVLARKTPVMIFDEPEAGIDLWSFEDLTNIFKSLRDQKKYMIIIISHQEKIIQLADNVIVLKNGKISHVEAR